MKIHYLSLSMLFLVLVCFIPLNSQDFYSKLQMPDNIQHSPLVKVYPDRQIYGLSILDSAMLFFDMNGALAKQIDLLDDRPQEIKYYYFDFCVGENGRIYILAVWRDKPQQTHSGVFVYDAAFRYIGLVEFNKHVDGRKITLDAMGNFVVLGMTTDFYFGKSSRLHLFHRYSPGGNYLGSFFEVNPQFYSNFANPDPPAVYARLRPIVDHLPFGSSQQGIFAVIPETLDIQLFDSHTLAPSTILRIQPPKIEQGLLPETLKSKTILSTAMQITAVQITDTSIAVDFDQSTKYQGPSVLHARVRAIYDPSTLSLRSAVKITQESGELIEQLGVPSSQLFTFSPNERKIKLLR